MSLTALAWLFTFFALALASVKRPVYAALAHLMTFFASPVLWWFGAGVLTSLTMRWSFLAAGVLLAACLNAWRTYPPISAAGRRFLWLTVLIGINGFLVNALLANYPPESSKVFEILWKGCLASVLVFLSMRDQDDLELFLLGIVLGCGFVGYEVVFTGQGSIEQGRLEGFSFPGAQGSNAGSAVLSLGLVIAGYFVISMHRRWYALASLVSAPLILETILRCNSRGAYLGLVVSGVVFFCLARGASRKRAALLCMIGGLSILLLAQDAGIWERFSSIFASEEERDGSASERLLYWESALEMIGDYPLGSGGEAAFTSPRGVEYIRHFRPEFRSVHNGVLDIAAGWGVQGLMLFLFVIGNSVLAANRASKTDILNGDIKRALLGTVLLAALAGQFICSMFTSVLDGEWFLWLSACCLVYARIVERETEQDDADLDLDLTEE